MFHKLSKLSIFLPFRLFSYNSSKLKKISIQIAALLLICSSSQVSFAAESPVYTSRFSSLALSGYDAVAYFTDNAAYRGKKEFQYEWKSVKWRFYTQENMDKFVLSPESYEPQFGGYCSYAMGLGQKASSDPTQFTIIDNKLYMNYSSKTKVLWEGDLDNMLVAGKENWQELLVE